MGKAFLRIVVFFVSFAFGMYLVSTVRDLSSDTGSYGNLSLSVSPVEGLPLVLQEQAPARFSPFGRGCGMGYVQMYETDDGQRTNEGVAAFGSTREARREFRLAVRNAERVIEKIPNYTNWRGKTGERIVVLNRPNDDGERSASIYFYDGTDHFRYIDAPTEELAHEFELFLIVHEYRPGN